MFKHGSFLVFRKKKEVEMVRVRCPICELKVIESEVDEHEKSHFELLVDTRESKQGLGSPFREDVSRVDTVVYRVSTSSREKAGGCRTFMTDTFIANSIAKISAQFPKGTQVQVVPSTYVQATLHHHHDVQGSILIEVLIIVTI